MASARGHAAALARGHQGPESTRALATPAEQTQAQGLAPNLGAGLLKREAQPNYN